MGGAYYWTSEPAVFPRTDNPSLAALHGRSFTVDAACFNANPKIASGWRVWPVAGVPDYGIQAKWQRTHGNRVRPMVEPPAP